MAENVFHESSARGPANTPRGRAQAVALLASSMQTVFLGVLPVGIGGSPLR
jgi:hypothetical protein